MYKVELRKGFTGTGRNRAGMSFSKGEAYELDLSKEQLEALRNDPEFIVEKVKKERASGDEPEVKQAAGRRQRAKLSNGEPIVEGKEEVSQVADTSGTVDTSAASQPEAKKMVDNQEEKQA